ncbi:MAG: phospho-sugar mutase [Anaerovoracaceae bacterium]|jgi:phosphoglucomutase
MDTNFEMVRAHALKEYERWLDNTVQQENFHNRLLKLYSNEEEIIDSFYTDLHFGTSGIRGLTGPGTNRINGFVIRRAAQGVADYIKKSRIYPEVVIGYDNRNDSQRFAYETAAVFNGNGIKVNLFREIVPTPVLSFAVRELKCSIGIMITASHNPKRYNGFKVYNEKGYQVVGRDHDIISEEIEKLDYFTGIGYKKDENITYVDENLRKMFARRAVEALPPIDPDVLGRFKTVYTPLNGTGLPLMEEVFREIGYENYKVCESQANPDEEFTTCPVPNPERILAYNEAFKTLDNNDADIVIANDPDGDRAGAAIYHDGMRTLLTGNQIGILMLDYLCHIRPPRSGQILIKSAVTSPLIEKIAAKYRLHVITTPIGFKYIGEIISKLSDYHREDAFYFGMEESDGYLITPFIREKDGFSSGALITEIGAFHRSQGKDLIDRLFEIYGEFGACMDKTRNYVFNGAEGQIKMQKIMKCLRSELHEGGSLGSRTIVTAKDYLEEYDTIPFDLLQYDLDDGSRVQFRPSGTEPKMRVYTFARGDLSDVDKDIVRIIERFKYDQPVE